MILLTCVKWTLLTSLFKKRKDFLLLQRLHHAFLVIDKHVLAFIRIRLGIEETIRVPVVEALIVLLLQLRALWPTYTSTHTGNLDCTRYAVKMCS